jgi:hypothetical protein
VVREHLTDVTTMVEQSDIFSVLAHIDYPVRSWPAERAGPFDPAAFEDEFRAALRATAQSGRALEINTRLPLHGTILTWWHQEGGDAVTFGSDAHIPSLIGHGFAEAAHMAEAYGFRPRQESVRPLGASGPGYWRHEPLAGYDRRTARLLGWVREVGAECDAAVGSDLVHLDYHPGNILVSDGRITGVVDWDGAARGDRHLDPVTFRFDLALRASDLTDWLDDILLTSFPEIGSARIGRI